MLQVKSLEPSDFDLDGAQASSGTELNTHGGHGLRRIPKPPT